MNYLQNLWESLFQKVPAGIYAVVLLILAWAVASLAKRLVIEVLRKIKADKLTDKLGITDEATGSSLEFLGKLIFIIVFLLFLPGVLNQLGMENVSAPISTLVATFLNYIPNILAAVVILSVGLFAANIIRQLLVPLLKRANVDKIQEKAGIKAGEGTSISAVISYLAYVLILLPVFIAALEVLNIYAISEPAIAMLNKIILFLPNVFVALAVIIIGVYIARIVGNLLVSILSSVGADKLSEKLLPTSGAGMRNFSLAKSIGGLVKYIIILLFVVEGINVLNLEVLLVVGDTIIAYLPFAISAVIIMGGSILLSNWVESLLRNRFPASLMTALAAKWLILILAVFMTLNQLGIATTIVNAAFVIVLGAVAVAAALAFGLGGKDFAAGVLSKLDKKISDDR